MGVTVFAGRGVERGDVELAVKVGEIVRDHDAADRAEQGAVADEPGENIAGRVGDEFPRHHHDANQAVIRPPRRNVILRGARCAKSLAGDTTLAAMLVARVAIRSCSSWQWSSSACA